MSVIERFWRSVAKSEGCWLWTACTNAAGYGRLSVDGAPMLAHRFSFELHHGPVPDGLCVLHRCDTPPCVNPLHLFVGTRAENSADMVAKGRSPQSRGERSGKAKLTDAQVEEIRELALVHGLRLRSIAVQFGVHESYVSRLVRGERRVA